MVRDCPSHLWVSWCRIPFPDMVIQSPLLAGQSFHEFERYREYLMFTNCNQSQTLLTEMSVCTTLDLPLPRLAASLPLQICALSAQFTCQNPNMIQEKQMQPEAPACQELVYKDKDPDPRDFTSSRDFNYYNAIQGHSGCGLLQHICLFTGSLWTEPSVILCPRSESLQIEDVDLTKQP